MYVRSNMSMRDQETRAITNLLDRRLSPKREAYQNVWQQMAVNI